jgi:hypothetical protein
MVCSVTLQQICKSKYYCMIDIADCLQNFYLSLLIFFSCAMAKIIPKMMTLLVTFQMLIILLKHL